MTDRYDALDVQKEFSKTSAFDDLDYAISKLEDANLILNDYELEMCITRIKQAKENIKNGQEFRI